LTPAKFLARHATQATLSHVLTPYTHLTIQKIDTYNALGSRADESRHLTSFHRHTGWGAKGLNYLPYSGPKAP